MGKKWEKLTAEEKGNLSYDEREKLIIMYNVRKYGKISAIAIAVLFVIITISQY